MSNRNKLDSESELTFLGKKRNGEKSKKKYENGLSIITMKNTENNYDIETEAIKLQNRYLKLAGEI